MRISEIIHDRVERYRDRTFLKAAMAASALTAYADGSVSVTERFKVDEILERLERLHIYDKVDEILERLERLHIYDAQKAVEKFEDYVSALEDNTEQALEISYADTYFNRAERMQFDAICGALGLESKDYTEGLH
jgi:tellurite resistance protein